MFHFFKTSIDFNILASPEGWLFEHLIGNEKGLRICPFGRIAIFASNFYSYYDEIILIYPNML